MKIIQTNKAYYPKVGGIETTITTLSEGLVENYNLDVHALVCNSKYSLKTIDKIIKGVKVKYLPVFGFIASLPISPGYFKSLFQLSGDILHVHEPFPLADLAFQVIPRIRKKFSRIVVSWHSDIIRQKWVLSFYKKYIFEFLNIADKIIVSNPNLIENSDFLPSFRDKCEVVPIGVDLSWVNSSSDLKINSINDGKSSLILFVGRLVYYKGIEYLIEAMKFVPDSSLVIIGTGPLKKQLINRINELKLSKRIKIIPEVDEKTLHEYYKSCDFLVLPSVEKSETYGIVQIEAMACAKPVICTELGTGTTFINQNGVTGIVVPPRDSKSLAEAINKLNSDQKLKSYLGEHARERAMNEFNSHKMIEKIYKTYQTLLEE